MSERTNGLRDDGLRAELDALRRGQAWPKVFSVIATLTALVALAWPLLRPAVCW